MRKSVVKRIQTRTLKAYRKSLAGNVGASTAPLSRTKRNTNSRFHAAKLLRKNRGK